MRIKGFYMGGGGALELEPGFGVPISNRDFSTEGNRKWREKKSSIGRWFMCIMTLDM